VPFLLVDVPVALFALVVLAADPVPLALSAAARPTAINIHTNPARHRNAILLEEFIDLRAFIPSL
jgi:hypothetical protein